MEKIKYHVLERPTKGSYRKHIGHIDDLLPRKTQVAICGSPGIYDPENQTAEFLCVKCSKILGEKWVRENFLS